MPPNYLRSAVPASRSGPFFRGTLLAVILRVFLRVCEFLESLAAEEHSAPQIPQALEALISFFRGNRTSSGKQSSAAKYAAPGPSIAVPKIASKPPFW